MTVSDPVIIPYKVMNRLFTTINVIITGVRGIIKVFIEVNNKMRIKTRLI